jgi:hypothetical protein
MKAQHRHELETNALAKRLAVAVERLRPYTPMVAGVVIAGVLGLAILSYLSTESSARQGETWNTFNTSVEGLIPNLDRLKETAEENAGTPTQLWANATWADGQLWMACRAYVQDHTAAIDAANRARTVYEGLLQSTDNPQLMNRAQLGLGRVYELRNEPDKARDHYSAVTGAFAEYAKGRAETLAEQKTQDTYDWLASAPPQRRTQPAGVGTPGKRPDFSVGDLDIPGTGNSPTAERPTATSEDLLKEFLPDQGKDVKDRYQTGGDTAPGSETPKQDAPTK